jgi:hypothetical protein
MGRIFAHLAIFYFGKNFEKNSPHFCRTFFSRLRFFTIKKMGWATFWAIFSQDRLVTLTLVKHL